MQELHNDLMNEAGYDKSIFENLLDTSIKWATFCLKNNRGKALKHGLNISKELSNYYYELEEE